ncbi:MAG: SGNH/GDSL hydrolase family protein [Lentisphaeria bacterium]|nr:SGNH/GDSL hydrolase family protein [Lentisphaeria bacterium]
MEKQVDYRDFLPENSTRKREDVEWVQFYSFNSPDTGSPRVLSIGDSICCQYKDFLREELAGKVNLTSWGTSKCVTDPSFVEELDHILSFDRYDLILFNNGIHALTSRREEWEKAYERTLDFLAAKLPEVPVSLLLSTPPADEEKFFRIRELNEFVLLVGERRNLPVVDLFTPMAGQDRKKALVDDYHFADFAKRMQAEILAKHITGRLAEKIALHKGPLKQAGSDMGPMGKIRSL